MKVRHYVKPHYRVTNGKKVVVKGHPSTHQVKMKFYDLKSKKTFETDNYKVQTKSGRTFAVAPTPSGSTAWRIMAKTK